MAYKSIDAFNGTTVKTYESITDAQFETTIEPAREAPSAARAASLRSSTVVPTGLAVGSR